LFAKQGGSYETDFWLMSRTGWQLLIGLVAGIVVMSVVVLSGQELKHVPPAAPSFVVLHSFDGADGAHPAAGGAGLVRDAAGNLYGTTTYGGRESKVCIVDCGVVFKLSPTGTETELHSFIGSDGGNPFAGLVRDAAGNLYGTTAQAGEFNGGVVFKVSPTGTETVLHNFGNPVDFDGFKPVGGMARDAAGNLYGTTFGGGIFIGTCEPFPFGCGVVFKMSPTGTETVLHAFMGDDGAQPYAGLTQDTAGNLYGTTRDGGASGHGVVFKLSLTGTETVLHSFTGGADGGNPVAGLMEDAAGNLYGTAADGRAHGYGVVFELIRCDSGSSGYDFKVLHNFTGRAGGANPEAGLIQDAGGNLYGTTAYGGTSNAGVVFRVAP
jgi:uncharacterized repeat protein (TIGR03803 family)